ncbi:hypothetical protein M747DRAFT_121986 [Aspergillus niger ATCC 13496]|uniref:Uncharacterized protein n=1 Tax=Aspergillus niger ATCC 13496 TaxID=1353008 RepID=A0A370BKT4_ASPNG|nr:hypothetical protein M747DRAFT_121986 [Aspergillus niger ATCC 13496]
MICAAPLLTSEIAVSMASPCLFPYLRGNTTQSSVTESEVRSSLHIRGRDWLSWRSMLMASDSGAMVQQRFRLIFFFFLPPPLLLLLLFFFFSFLSSYHYYHHKFYQ